MSDSYPAATFAHIAREMGARKLAFIMAREYLGLGSLGPQLKAAFGGVYIANEGFDYAGATAALKEGRADAVGFGKLALANPDLVARFAQQAKLKAWDAGSFYSPEAKGYTDYPALATA